MLGELLYYLKHPIRTWRYKCDLCEHRICRCPKELY